MPAKTCGECGAELPVQQGRARPRKFCTACRPPRNRPNPRVIRLAPENGASSGPAVPAAPGPAVGLAAVVEQRLAAAGRLTDPVGAQALLLAQMLAAGGHTASGAASLSRELRAALDAALAGAPAEPDEMDEIAARRAAKAAKA